MKYDWKFKLKCVIEYKEGIRDLAPPGTDNHSFLNHVRRWAKAFDDLGIDGLRHSPTNRGWTAEQRLELVAKALAGNSITSVAKNAHINPGQLYQCEKRFRENGMFYGHESEFETFEDLYEAIA